MISETISKYINIGAGIIIVVLLAFIYHLNSKVDSLEELNKSNQNQIELLRADNTGYLAKLKTLTEQTEVLRSNLQSASDKVHQLNIENQKYINQLRQQQVSDNSQESLDWLVDNVKELNKEWNK